MHRNIGWSLAVSLVLWSSMAMGDEARAVRRVQVTPQAVVVVQNAVQLQRVGGVLIGEAPQEVDRTDPIQRIVMFTPGGPLVVQLAITVDGKPFREAREALLDEMLARADADGDGRATWDESLERITSTYGSLGVRINPQQREAVINSYDVDGDGLVSRYECRRLLNGVGQGGEFLIVPNYGNYSLNRTDTLKVLDADSDGALSREEIAAAADRLKSRDADDNDLLYALEAAGVNNPAMIVRGGRGMGVAPSIGMAIGDKTDFNALLTAMNQQYAVQGKISPARFTLLPKLFAALDSNANGELEAAELAPLGTMLPHVALQLNLGEADKKLPRVKQVGVAPELKEMVNVLETDGRITCELPGLNLQWAAAPENQLRFNYKQAADRMLAQYDKDKNGYLEVEELGGAANQGMAAMFSSWDQNRDDKVYAEEIEASYNARLLPLMSQVRAVASNEGNSLWDVLDETGDGRLSLPQMLTAADRLRTLDENQDGALSGDEVPITFQVTIGRGNTTPYAASSGGRVYFGQAQSPASGGGPQWFVHMDRNADGDITPREFLGAPEQFKQLDTNQDGFIERREAEAAESKKAN